MSLLTGGKATNNKYTSSRVKNYGEELWRIKGLGSDGVILYIGG